MSAVQKYVCQMKCVVLFTLIPSAYSFASEKHLSPGIYLFMKQAHKTLLPDYNKVLNVGTIF
jgi:hypothetical protein